MRLRVLTASKSPRIAQGLTYDSGDRDIRPGTLVKIPLRKEIVDGLVLDVLAERSKEKFAVKEIVEGGETLLTCAQMKTLLWISDHYCVSPRRALSLFLPDPPWGKLRDESSQHRSSDNVIAATEMPKPTLLFGADRSGSYIRLIDEALKRGEQCIALFPEVDDVITFSKTLSQRFPGVMQSAFLGTLTAATERKEWLKIYRGEARIVLGTRSAIFAPCRELGLVIIDNEQEWTYKEQRMPCTHARDVAIKLCEYTGAKLIIGTSFPSVELWARVRAGICNLTPIPSPKRDVRIIDLKGIPSGKHYPFSAPLIEALEKCLDRREKSVLLLNRKGTETVLLCRGCHWRGGIAEADIRCPSCGCVDLIKLGAGTRKAESILKEFFPSARIARLESGTASSPSFESADIIVGTQSVLPLLNDPKITLACALIADIGMSQPDFRASERAAQRLSMLLHRGSQIKREVIIQTFRPDAPEILTLAKDSPMEFLDHELRLRKELDYPPFSTMIALLCRGGQAEASAEMLKSSLKGIHIQKAVLPKKDVRLLLRGHDLQQSLVSLDLKDVSIDVDPVEL